MAKYPKFYPPPPPRPRCSTARRLAMLRQLWAGATCETSKKMVRKVAAAWWGNGAADGHDVKVARQGREGEVYEQQFWY